MGKTPARGQGAPWCVLRAGKWQMAALPWDSMESPYHGLSAVVGYARFATLLDYAHFCIAVSKIPIRMARPKIPPRPSGLSIKTAR